jgi:phenylacetate-CoA ligase
MIIDVLRKFVGSSASLERAAWDVYERLPASFKYRMLHGPAFHSWLTLLRGSENWDQERVHAFQIEQTKMLLMHSHQHIPYYRNLFSQLGFRPHNFQSFDDLSRLPYLGKEQVRDNAEEFIDEHIPLKSLSTKLTGGSSGIPLTVYRSRDSLAAFLAFRVNILGRIGHTPKSREVMLWHDLQLGDKSIPFVRYGNKLVFSMKYLDEQLLLKYWDMIRKFSPEYLLGYPSALTVFAIAVKRSNLPLPRIMKAVIAYAETLSIWQRNLMEESFGSRVFSMYSMTEYTAIGGDCESSSCMHFHPLYGLIEFADAPLGYREVVATGFTNYAMPFIRYRTGDLVTEHGSSCSKCGRKHTVVGNIEGKSHEFLIGRDGQLIHIRPLLVAGFPSLLQYQFYQEDPGIVYFRIVPSKTFSKDDKSCICQKLDEFLGPKKNTIGISVVPVEHIQTTSSGKVAVIEQKLDIQKFVV